MRNGGLYTRELGGGKESGRDPEGLSSTKEDPQDTGGLALVKLRLLFHLAKPYLEDSGEFPGGMSHIFQPGVGEVGGGVVAGSPLGFCLRFAFCALIRSCQEL